VLEKFSVDDEQITQTSGKIMNNNKNVQGSHQLTSTFPPTCFCCEGYMIDLPWIGGEGEEYIGGSFNEHSGALVNCGPLLHLLSSAFLVLQLWMKKWMKTWKFFYGFIHFSFNFHVFIHFHPFFQSYHFSSMSFSSIFHPWMKHDYHLILGFPIYGKHSTLEESLSITTGRCDLAIAMEYNMHGCLAFAASPSHPRARRCNLEKG